MPREYYKCMWNTTLIEKLKFLVSLRIRTEMRAFIKPLLRIITVLNDQGFVEYYFGFERFIDEHIQMKEWDKFNLASVVFNPQESQASAFI